MPSDTTTPASLASGPDETEAIRELETWIDGNVPYTLRPTLWRLVQSALRAALSENERLSADRDNWREIAEDMSGYVNKLAKRILDGTSASSGERAKGSETGHAE